MLQIKQKLLILVLHRTPADLTGVSCVLKLLHCLTQTLISSQPGSLITNQKR